MELFEYNHVQPIKEYIEQRLHIMYDSHSELKILLSLKAFINNHIADCAVASDEEVRDAYTDENGVLYSYDGSKLIKGNNMLKSYVIRTGTKIICDNAFADCTLLTSLSIPDTVEIIGHRSFSRCRRLLSLIIPDSVRKIGKEVFWACYDLVHVSWPEINYIPESAFNGCGFDEFEIPSSVKVLEEMCFADCTFKRIIIPRSVEVIEDKAFLNCKNLISIEFEFKLEALGKDAFMGCDSLKYIYVPKGFKKHFEELLPETLASFIIEDNSKKTGTNNNSDDITIPSPLDYSIAKEPIGTEWPFVDFLKIYQKWGIIVAADSKKGLLYYGIFEDTNNNSIVTCVSHVVRNYSEKAMNNSKNNLIVRVMNSHRYCLCTKWEDVNLR